MLGWIKKIFGSAAEPPPPPPQISAQKLVAAKLLPQKSIWNLIRDNDLTGLQQLIAEDPSQLHNTADISIRKRINLKMKPAHYAAYVGQAAALILLHQNGADINEAAPQGYTCLHLAARCKTGGVATAYLLEKGTIGIDALSANGTTALMEAARSGNETGVKELLARNPETEITSALSPPAMALAARNGHFGIVVQLVDHGASMDVTDSMLRSPLWLAAHERREDIVDFLMAKGAATEGYDLQGETLLMVAAQRGNHKLLTALLDAGHDPNNRDNNGNTALHYASHDEGNNASAHRTGKLLVARGAWIDAQNRAGESPLDHARLKHRGATSLIPYLEAVQNDPAAARTPTINEVFQAGAKREVKVMKALKIRAAANQPNS